MSRIAAVTTRTRSVPGSLEAAQMGRVSVASRFGVGRDELHDDHRTRDDQRADDQPLEGERLPEAKPELADHAAHPHRFASLNLRICSRYAVEAGRRVRARRQVGPALAEYPAVGGALLLARPDRQARSSGLVARPAAPHQRSLWSGGRPPSEAAGGLVPRGGAEVVAAAWGSDGRRAARRGNDPNVRRLRGRRVFAQGLARKGKTRRARI
jgi:hypothetical protein